VLSDLKLKEGKTYEYVLHVDGKHGYVSLSINGEK